MAHAEAQAEVSDDERSGHGEGDDEDVDYIADNRNSVVLIFALLRRRYVATSLTLYAGSRTGNGTGSAPHARYSPTPVPSSGFLGRYFQSQVMGHPVPSVSKLQITVSFEG